MATYNFGVAILVADNVAGALLIDKVSKANVYFVNFYILLLLQVPVCTSSNVELTALIEQLAGQAVQESEENDFHLRDIITLLVRVTPIDTLTIPS